MAKNPLIKVLKRFYSKYTWWIWIVIIALTVFAYFNYEKISDLVLPTTTASVWQFGGAGITTGIILMLIAIVVGIALIATGVGAPAGVFIILASLLLFGAKIAGISVLAGMVMDYFRRYRIWVLIIGGILLYNWIRRSSFRYTGRAPPPPGKMIFRK